MQIAGRLYAGKNQFLKRQKRSPAKASVPCHGGM
jgi:hypothetical protein